MSLATCKEKEQLNLLTVQEGGLQNHTLDSTGGGKQLFYNIL